MLKISAFIGLLSARLQFQANFLHVKQPINKSSQENTGCDMSTTKIPQEHKANKNYEVKLLPSPQRSANLTFRNAIIVET